LCNIESDRGSADLHLRRVVCRVDSANVLTTGDFRLSAMNQKQSTVKGFLVLSRLPFLLPGLAALTTGIGIAAAEGNDADVGFVSMSVAGLALIMLATYYFNEYFDYEGDVLNRRFIKFSGGSRALPDAMVPRKTARIAGWTAVAILVMIAAIYLLQYIDEYPLLLPMALFGAFCGIFYSHPPFQWAYKGVGEIMIGLCYGILAVVSGFYIASGELDLRMVAIGLPASITIFCVIVANEFPDIDADRAVNKKNLVVRLGLKRASVMYAVAMILVYPAMLVTMLFNREPNVIFIGLPVLILTLAAAVGALKGGYQERESQTKISGITLISNLLSSLLFIVVFSDFWKGKM
jgi:1,4-dihydroxy-2-naphthoate octaprenyltransferase